VPAQHEAFRDLGAEPPAGEQVPVAVAEGVEARRLLVETVGTAKHPDLGVVTVAEGVEIGGVVGDELAGGEIGDQRHGNGGRGEAFNAGGPAVRVRWRQGSVGIRVGEPGFSAAFARDSPPGR